MTSVECHLTIAIPIDIQLADDFDPSPEELEYLEREVIRVGIAKLANGEAVKMLADPESACRIPAASVVRHEKAPGGPFTSTLSS